VFARFYSCVSYPVYKAHLSNEALHFHVWHVLHIIFQAARFSEKKVCWT